MEIPLRQEQAARISQTLSFLLLIALLKLIKPGNLFAFQANDFATTWKTLSSSRRSNNSWSYLHATPEFPIKFFYSFNQVLGLRETL